MSIMKMLIAAGLMLGAPALAQEASTGASAEARQAVQQSFKKRDAELAPLRQKRDALQKQLSALMTAEGYDEEKLAATMAEIRSLEGEIVQKADITLLSLLKTLSTEDRNTFLKSLKRQPAASAPVPRRGAGAVGR